MKKKSKNVYLKKIPKLELKKFYKGKITMRKNICSHIVQCTNNGKNRKNFLKVNLY